MKNIKKITLIGLIFILALIMINISNISLTGISQSLNLNISKKFKNFLYKKVFVYQYNSLLRENIRVLEEKIIEKNSTISKLVDKGKKIDFYKNYENLVQIKDKNYQLIKFKTDHLVKSYPYGKSQSSTYLDVDEDKIWLTTAKGKFSFFDSRDLENKIFSSDIVETNLDDFVDFDEFYRDKSSYGVKDILIKDKKIFVSYTNQVKKDCFNISLLSADLNYNKLYFNKVFQPSDCVTKIDDDNNYHAIQSGGRIYFYGKNLFLLTQGEFRNRSLAQNKNSSFGKVLLIDLSKNTSEIVAMGLRNSQGMFYEKKSKYLFLTDHGPLGGDEINLMKLDVNNSEIINFGWPVSSYGKHYRGKKYEAAPLHKSHVKYGFEEPIKYFKNSIAISELTEISKNFSPFSDQNINLVVSSMGDNITEGDMSLHFLSVGLNKKIESYEVVQINKRIRDIKFLESENKLIMFLESGEIGIFKKIN
ncbi:PQQ-dependent sugar dehydrogenase [Pelagibacteraceae bacterium]|jgi:hypothetical protein|nr:PQQ-dependent sugar dehydrogenase [Pelagibacteraceae bacterium]